MSILNRFKSKPKYAEYYREKEEESKELYVKNESISRYRIY